MKTKINAYRIAQIVIGCCAAIAIAMAFGLLNSVSAGIIAILSLQDTKRETLRSAVERALAFLAAVGIAFVSFSLLGYTVIALGVYLLPFAIVCYRFKLQASLPICTVIVTHFFLAQRFDWALFGNEALLMIIGTGVGVLLNLFVPRDTKAIRAEQQKVEAALRLTLDAMGDALAEDGTETAVESGLHALRKSIRDASDTAKALANNTLFSDEVYYAHYVEMRRHQYVILRRIASTIDDLPEDRRIQGDTLARFLHDIADAIHEHNDAVALLDEVDALRTRFRESALPESREAFETRALLYRILVDTEHFLLIKKTFVDSLTDAQKKAFLLPPAS